MPTKATTMMMVMLAAMGTVCGDAWAGQSWLCSVGSAVAVDEDGTVGPPDLGDRERPTFFRLDADKKELTLLAPESRRGEVTKLDTVHDVNGQRVFSGVEHGRVVSVIVSTDGRMTLSIISDGVVWSVFGHALPEERTKD
ncbi:MAG: hypothetical protein NTW36_06145 [Planctomycetia bacterium]|jgi:hypothetical protein|nr:hypothetical protein [Planctomycetia bacterium]